MDELSGPHLLVREAEGIDSVAAHKRDNAKSQVYDHAVGLVQGK